MQEPRAKLWAGYPPKLVILALILALEKVPLLHLPPSWLLQGTHWFGGAPVLFGLALLFFSRGKPSLAEQQQAPISYGFASLHVVLLAFLAALQHFVAVSRFSTSSFHFKAAATLWTALIVAAIASLVSACIPPRKLWHVARGLGNAWVYAGACTVAIVTLRHFASLAWDVSSSPISQYLLQACFNQTQALLKWFYPIVIALPSRHMLGTPLFLVDVSWLCSGIEGLAFVAVLIIIWLVFTRHELRIGRAILIAPLALVFTWCLNLVRLATLIAIGNAGYGRIASNGFHSQAGWITLNLAALGFLLLIQHVSWFSKHAASSAITTASSGQQSHLQPPLQTQSQGAPPVPKAATQNTTLPYLLPFAAVAAASMVSQAFSSGFEWLYPLRFVAAIAALWIFRKQYRAMDWRFGLVGPLAGLAVAAMWIVLRLTMVQTAAGDFATATGLESLPAIQRIGWIAIRVLASVITVPIVEELAFRGFLARRVMSADFEEIPYTRLNLLALIVSAAAFAAMHGQMWPAGAVAGLLFGLVAKWRGRLGEAVAAHAVANLAIAVLAIVRTDYSMW